MTLKGILPVAVAALAIHASSLAAQAATADLMTATTTVVVPTVVPTVAAEPVATVAGPRLDQSRAGIAVVRSSAVTAPAVAPEQDITRRRGVPQMIIGGAAILGGAIVGDDAGAIISVAGLVYGLYGLYLYLQ